VEEGQEIDSGKVVGIIDTMDLSLKKYQVLAQRDATAARKADLEAQVAIYQQNKTNTLVDKARIEKMMKDGAATRKQADDVNAALNVSDKQIASVESQFGGLRDQVEGLQRQIDQISKSIQDSKIVNPVRGTILTKFSEPNEVTTYGKPVYKIADLTYLNLRVYVSGAQLSRIKTGQEVEVRFDQDEKTLTKSEGVVSWISPTAEFTPKTIQTKEERVNLVYAVKVRVKNDGRLKIGMPGEIRFMH
jgi:HlyD family secretion protein